MAKSWTAIPSAEFLLGSTGTFLGGGLSSGVPFTLLRMLGEYVIVPRSGAVALDNVEIGVGIARVSSDAFTAGAAFMPDPIGDEDFPWLYWASHKVIYHATALDPSSPGAAVRRAFDIKTMRKFKPSETVALIVQYVDIVGTPALQVSVGTTRILTAQ